MYLFFPFITYTYFNNDVSYGKMVLAPTEYYPYTLGAIFFFRLGLQGNKKENQIGFDQFLGISNNPKNWYTGIALICTGFASLFIQPFVPLGLQNFLYLLSSIRFIGVIYLLYTKNKYKSILIGLVFLHYVLRTIAGTLFYELFTWLALISIYLLIYKTIKLRTKILLFIAAWFGLFVIQIVKTEYRTAVWDRSEEATAAFSRAFTQEFNSERDLEFMNSSNIEKFTARLNLGWVVSEIVRHVDEHALQQNGKKLFADIPSIILPRFLYPQKKMVAGEDLRKEFEKYTGRKLNRQTTINISALGDAYINFGFIGGWMLLYFLGHFIRWFMKKIKNISFTYPDIIIWMPLIFFDFIRMNDFYFLLNSVLKNTFLVMLIFYIFSNYFRRPAHTSISQITL